VLVALFYKNTESEIRQILTRYHFKMVQLYAGDVSPAFVRGLKQKVALACRIGETADLDVLEDYAADVDFFILDGAVPGSGRPVGAAIPCDFPYPFLLAGGMDAGNLELARQYDNCIGVDIASGIETAGEIDFEKVKSVAAHLEATRTSTTV
jgi:phosphoribosylanthranilate isomerase